MRRDLMAPSTSANHLNREFSSIFRYLEISNFSLPSTLTRRLSVLILLLSQHNSPVVILLSQQRHLRSRRIKFLLQKMMMTECCWSLSLENSMAHTLLRQRSSSFGRSHSIQHRLNRSSFPEFRAYCRLLNRLSDSCWAMRLCSLDGPQSATTCNMAPTATYWTTST